MALPYILTPRAVGHTALSLVFGRPYKSWSKTQFARFIDGLELDSEQRVILEELLRRSK